MKKWYVGYFYNGYLKQLRSSFSNNEQLFKEVKMWYPQLVHEIAKNGKKEYKLKPIFDNYVLFNFEEDSLIWTDIVRRTPIIKFLKSGDGELIPLSEEEVIRLQELEAKVTIADYKVFIKKRIIVTGGPFKGLTGFCKAIIKGRNTARVYITLFNVVQREVEINLEHLDLYEEGDENNA